MVGMHSSLGGKSVVFLGDSRDSLKIGEFIMAIGDYMLPFSDPYPLVHIPGLVARRDNPLAVMNEPIEDNKGGGWCPS